MPSDAHQILVPMNFDGFEVLVQAASGVQAGSEPTSAADKVGAAFQDAEATIRAVAGSVARTVSSLRASAVPDAVEVEFGLGVTLNGNAILVSGSSEASLVVRLTYDGSRSHA